MKLIVAISGASGCILGLRLLEVLQEKKVETHAVVTKAAELLLKIEHGLSRDDVLKHSSHIYDIDDMTAPIASGSFRTDGMVVIPCSMKTLAAISHGYSNNLLLRAADVTLKEGRKLVLVVRETPLNIIHLRNMLMAAEAGAIILPPNIAFYHKPQSIKDLVDHIVGKVLDVLNMEHNLYRRWTQAQLSTAC